MTEAPPRTVAKVIEAWLAKQPANTMNQSKLARLVKINRSFMNSIIAGDREFPDSRLQFLPNDLRAEIADVLAIRHETIARFYREIERKARVLHSAVQAIVGERE